MKPLVDKKYKLEKYPGKGGWTYAVLPDTIRENVKKPFGWRKVCGSIDDYVIKQYTLMPMGDGRLFLPVKAEIRKAINKEAGDTVHITLYPDDSAVEVPGELQLCLEDEPQALRFFTKLSDSEKKYYIQWIYGAKKQETKIDRMAKTIERLARGLKMHDKEL
ncbi:MAG: YdeI/OmpD-associated family protein [Flavipsychrobacter sp.]|nr:DUF1905 domain-containing protein [Chitinophagales bacterium]